MHGVSIGRLLKCADAAGSIRAPKRAKLVMSPRQGGWRPGAYTRSSHSENVPSKYLNGTMSSR